MEYQLLSTLLSEVRANLVLHSPIDVIIQGFLKYLKEPRYQAPLTIAELSNLFHNFYRDLNCTIINYYTSSNSVKKSLISNSKYFNDHPKVFDYLLAIANYSVSSIKLLKRNDADALHQLRIFNYYKFIVIFETIELAHNKLFKSISPPDEISLYDKIFRFDQKDIIHEEFLEEKIAALKALELPCECFVDKAQIDFDKYQEFMTSLTEAELQKLQHYLTALNSTKTPYSKLLFIVKLHKNIIQLFLDKGYKSSQINNDILLPTLIYLIIYKLSSINIYSNFLFIKNFINMIDPYRIELYQLNVNGSYVPTEKFNKLSYTKYRSSNLFELLMLNEQTENSEVDYPPEFTFFNSDRDLIQYLSNTYLNNGELNYYLTNFEAVMVFLSTITISELSPEMTSTNDLLNTSIFKLVDQDLQTHFKFPDGKLAEEIKSPENSITSIQNGGGHNRSRSSSLINSLASKFNETRSRSNSSVVNSMKSSSKESFPTIATTADIDSLNSHADGESNSSIGMVKTFLGRFNSVTSQPFNTNTYEIEDDNNSFASSLNGKISNKNTLLNRASPSHSRTRSSSLEQGGKRSSITNKFATGMNEIITKLNSTNTLQIAKNTSDSSLNSLEEGENSTATLKQDFHTRSRNTSLQIMDKWFSNLGSNLNSTTKNKDVIELTKFKDCDFDNLSVKDLKMMKQYYDILCQQMLAIDKATEEVAHDTKNGTGEAHT